MSNNNDDDVVEEIPPPQEEADDNDDDDQEYNVEDIRAKRINPKTKNIEYLIKWENYPETSNTWEPVENVMCPDLIIKFNEREQKEQKNKRKKRRASNTSSSNESQVETKKSKTSQPALLLEDEAENSLSNQTDDQNTIVSIPKQPTGFERGTPLQNILGSCVDDGEKLYFFVQFEGAKEMDMVDYEEIVKHAPKQLCDWYKQRQYEAIYQNDREQQKEVSK